MAGAIDAMIFYLPNVCPLTVRIRAEPKFHAPVAAVLVVYVQCLKEIGELGAQNRIT